MEQTPLLRGSGWGQVGWDEQPKHLHQSGIMSRKRVFSLEEEKKCYDSVQAFKYLLIEDTFGIKSHHSTVRKIDLFNLKRKQLQYNAKKLAPPHHEMLTAENTSVTSDLFYSYPFFPLWLTWFLYKTINMIVPHFPPPDGSLSCHMSPSNLNTTLQLPRYPILHTKFILFC